MTTAPITSSSQGETAPAGCALVTSPAHANRLLAEGWCVHSRLESMPGCAGPRRNATTQWQTVDAAKVTTDPVPYVPHVDRDMLMRGDELRNGMVVRLLAPFGSHPAGWVTVSRLRVSPPSRTRGWDGGMILGLPSSSYDMPAQVSFAATAEDGVLSTWDGAVSHWWIVRKDSLPTPPQHAATHDPAEIDA